MKILGNIIWWIFGGLETAVGYLTAGLILCLTIVGIPFGLQLFKMALVMLFPFGSTVSPSQGGVGSTFFNILWFLLAGVWIAIVHWLFGILLFITIIGIPFGQRHFKFAKVALWPFGRDIDVKL
jgi:uncharacterized membrane protein YccF (DUF307 family)